MDQVLFGNDKGKLYLAGRNDSKSANALTGKIARLCITRGRAPYGMEKWQSKDSNTMIGALAPSEDLIFKFWNNSNKDADAFEQYTSRWHDEKHHYDPSDEYASMSDDHRVFSSQRYYEAITRICELLDSGVSVVLGCWCVNSYCHRFLVAEDVEKRMREVK